MSDVKKSIALRAILWIPAMAVVGVLLAITDVTLDKLPIRFSPSGDHHAVEGSLFWGIVGTGVWRWLSKRVWIASLPSQVTRPNGETP